MTDTEAIAVTIGLFALRCIAPLALTLAVGYVMNRLVDRWAAADELAATEAVELEPAADIRPGLSLPTITVPCWIMRNCTPEMRADCPAHKEPGLPCWLVRLRVEGMMPEDCPDCPIYEGKLAPA